MTRDDADEQAAELDFEHRRLCPDGACIGVIGSDGRCRVCGHPAGDEAAAAPVSSRPATADDEGVTPGEAGDASAGAAARSADGSGDGEAAATGDEDRELCPDGACIGVLGEGGRCKLCGKPRGWMAAEDRG